MAILVSCLSHALVPGRPTDAGKASYCCCSSSSSTSSSSVFMIGVRAAGGVKPGRIGSRRRKGGRSPSVQNTEPTVDDRRKEPFLQSYMRQFRDEGHQVLDDAEFLLEKASNPYGLVLRIAEEANEYLLNNKEESLIRKPILKVISDRINDIYGEKVTDSYLNEKEDLSEYEEEDDSETA